MASSIENPLADSVFLWHDSLATYVSDTHLRWVANLRSFFAGLGGRPLTVGSMFSGSEILSVILSVMLRFWQAMYGQVASTRHVFMCERNADKQEFLKSQFQPAVLFEEASALGGLTAQCVLANRQVLVPYADLFVAGSCCGASERHSWQRVMAGPTAPLWRLAR